MVDGLQAFPEAIRLVFPKTVVQTCIVHLIRNSMQFASCKEQRPLVAALKPIYQAESAAAVRERLEVLTAARGDKGSRSVKLRKYPSHLPTADHSAASITNTSRLQSSSLPLFRASSREARSCFPAGRPPQVLSSDP